MSSTVVVAGTTTATTTFSERKQGRTEKHRLLLLKLQLQFIVNVFRKISHLLAADQEQADFHRMRSDDCNAWSDDEPTRGGCAHARESQRQSQKKKSRARDSMGARHTHSGEDLEAVLRPKIDS